MKEGFNSQTLLEILNAREAIVKFNKLDGTLRTMRCTLNRNLVPETIQRQWNHLNVNGTNDTEHLITVYDLEYDGWRSFHPENIVEVL